MPRPPPTSRKLHAGPEAVQLDIDAGHLGQGVLDAADVGDLAAEMEVDQLQAIGHAALLEKLEGVHRLGKRQAELGAIAGTDSASGRRRGPPA